MVEFLPKGKNRIFERSVSDAIHLFYYLLSIIFYLN